MTVAVGSFGHGIHVDWYVFYPEWIMSSEASVGLDVYVQAYLSCFFANMQYCRWTSAGSDLCFINDLSRVSIVHRSIFFMKFFMKLNYPR